MAISLMEKFEIIQLRVGGMKVNDIAAKVGVCTSSVENVLKAGGVTKASMVKPES